MKKRNAFTLAEVLITLGIIGIVAAMTLPVLTTKYQKQLTVNQLKVAYAILYEALNLAQKDHGDYKYWTYFQEELGTLNSSVNFVNTYIKPYMKNVAVYTDNKIIGCKNIVYKYMDGSTVNCNSVIGFCGTCGTAGAGSGGLAQIHLANGMIIAVLTREANDIDTGEPIPLAEFHVDTNGLKGPNVWGKDIFRFSLTLRGGKFGSKNKSDMKFCGGDCHERSFDLANQCLINNAYGCAEVIIGDSWQIKDDYPWR